MSLDEVRRHHLQAAFPGIDEAQDGICAAKDNAAVRSWHCADSCDGIFAIHRLIRADLLACRQAGKDMLRYGKFVSVPSNSVQTRACSYLYTGPTGARYRHS